MVDKIKFVIKVTAKIPAWRQGNVPFPSARFWHTVMLLRHAMQTYIVMSALCSRLSHSLATGVDTAHYVVCPRPDTDTGPASVREREMREM